MDSYENVGDYLRDLRRKRGKSLFYVAKRLNISGNYLSQIERNLKVPSEVVIHNIAKYYELDEGDLLSRYGKDTSPAWLKDVEDIPHLMKMITSISLNKNFSSEQKDNISKELYELYNTYLKDKE